MPQAVPPGVASRPNGPVAAHERLPAPESRVVVALDGCRIDRVLGGAVELVDAAPRNRSFPDRVNESLGICLKTGAEHAVRANGRALLYPASSICVRAPGTVWSTAATGDVGFLSIDIEPSLLPEGGLEGAMRFVAPSAVPTLQRRADVLRSDAPPLAKESVVAELIDDLLRGGLVVARERGADRDRRAAERARELLTSRIADPPTLQELADAVGANRFVLLREFRRTFGVPPHAFVVRLRVERARMLFARGMGISEVSFELGFSDQPHLSRVFKRVVGMSPGAYRRKMRTLLAVNRVQALRSDDE